VNKGYFDKSSPEWIVPLKDEHGELLNLKKKKIHTARDKLNPNKKFRFRINSIVWGQQTDLAEPKVNFIAEILWDDETVSCWLCYYTLNKYGRWHFGQYGPMMPITDLMELYEYAHEKGIV